MDQFLALYSKSAITALGLFWTAFWAFGLGYLISSMIQVFVTRERMKSYMGESGPKSVALGTFFGFISSSCSFAALSTTRAIFAKGAGLIPSLAFLLASTNLVIELGIIIAVFLGWQFVVGEYIGGILLILFTWLIARITLKKTFENSAREKARQKSDASQKEASPNWKKKITTKKGWYEVAKQYLMEWKMVWKDVTIGFTVAGIIAVFVPKSFFEALFIGSSSMDPSFFQVSMQALIGPLAAFFTFIGSMGNIPLAAVLYENGVSFAGVMAFIFSDLVVLPVLRIQANYYGWKMALYILAVFLLALVLTAVLMHYSFSWLDLLPEKNLAQKLTDRSHFKVNYVLFFNFFFLFLSFGFVLWKRIKTKKVHSAHDKTTLSDRILFIVACGAILWLLGGLGAHFFFTLA